jgi:sarcosine oxidase, subunit gamma
VKGPDAALLLGQLGLPVPALPNRYTRLDAARHAGGGRCLRLGNSEFLVEQDGADSAVVGLQDALASTTLRAWPALRCDRSLTLRGANASTLLLQICDFDFATLETTPDAAVMTLMAEISVILVRDDDDAAQGIRIWCDPGYGDYLHDCLATLLNATGTSA